MHTTNAIVGNGAFIVPYQLKKKLRGTENKKSPIAETNNIKEDFPCPPVHVWVVRKLKARIAPTIITDTTTPGKWALQQRSQSVCVVVVKSAKIEAGKKIIAINFTGTRKAQISPGSTRAGPLMTKQVAAKNSP
jgi:hypothetical protein